MATRKRRSPRPLEHELPWNRDQEAAKPRPLEHELPWNRDQEAAKPRPLEREEGTPTDPEE